MKLSIKLFSTDIKTIKLGMDGRRIKGEKGGKWTYVWVLQWGEKQWCFLSQRSEQALPNNRNISPVIVIISVTKYTNRVAEDNFSKVTLPLLCDKRSDPVARDVCLGGAWQRLGGQSAILWSRFDSIANLKTLFSSSTQEMPCLTSTITLFNKDRSAPTDYWERVKVDSVCEDIS